MGDAAPAAARGLAAPRGIEARLFCELPHEVGVFIGYPLKDVAGFMQRIPATPVRHGAWRVYGGADESLRRMRLYANAEANAAQVLDRARGIEEFINAISAKKAS